MRRPKTNVILAVFLLTLAVSAGVGSTESLKGTPGASSQWGSGWLNLAPPVDFAKGDRLKLLIGGNADRILVRLLPKGQSPDSSVGIVGGPIEVPRTRVVELVLPQEQKQIVQVSAHGGPNPWGRFPLGLGNGPATIESAQRIRP